MPRKLCSMPECGKESRGRGLCATHWARWRKHGDPNIVLVSSKPKHVGCLVDGCMEKHHSLGYCSMHVSRFKKNGDPMVVGDHYPGRPRHEQLSYDSLHKRITYDRGKAKGRKCVDCGQAAQEWSYDGGCPNELRGGGVNIPLAYSMDTSRYSPRCIRCHRYKDESLNRGRGKDGRFVSDAIA